MRDGAVSSLRARGQTLPPGFVLINPASRPVRGRCAPIDDVHGNLAQQSGTTVDVLVFTNEIVRQVVDQGYLSDAVGHLCLVGYKNCPNDPAAALHATVRTFCDVLRAWPSAVVVRELARDLSFPIARDGAHVTALYDLARQIVAQRARLKASQFDATHVSPILSLPSMGRQPLLDALEAVRSVARSSAGYQVHDRLWRSDGIVCPLWAGSLGTCLGAPSLPAVLDFGRSLPHPPPLPDVVTYYWHRASDPTDGLWKFIAACLLCRIVASWWYSLSVDYVLCELPRPLLDLIMRSYHMNGGASRFPDELSPEEQEEHLRLRPYLNAFDRLQWAADVPDDKVLSSDDNALRADVRSEAEARVTKAQAEAAPASTTLSRLVPALGDAVDEVVRRVGATSQAPSAWREVTRRFRSIGPTPNADALTGARASIDSVVKDVDALVFGAEADRIALQQGQAAVATDLRTREATLGPVMAAIEKQIEEATSAVGAVADTVATDAHLFSAAPGTGTGRRAPGGGGAHEARDNGDTV
ncbi:hypothetical protein I4F81_003677 [Pyropia yezoensis]|uniref:Uncharacterized protein n=1 Tax=Pyropia yezoensis TaxID=2788 RepID=A0ACC3BU43_PYRYE|nr:hypothetical protein I4F81_003677 [Neopyropia yezoensis]